MNKYVEEIMNSKQGLPSTFEEFQLMHPVHSRLVPMSHVHELREAHDKKAKESAPSLGKIVF